MTFKTGCLNPGLPKILWENADFCVFNESTGNQKESYLA